MDETIDLHPYVEALLRRWPVILGAAVIGVLIAVLLYFAQSDYRATALVAVTDPAQRLQFDPRIVNTLELDVLLQAYPELATSNAVLSPLLEQARAMTNGSIDALPLLHEMLEVEIGADARLLRLHVRNGDPQLTADLANAWANTFVTIADSIYSSPGGDFEFFSDQLAQTNDQLQAAEQELVTFQSSSRMGIVDNELLALNNLLTAYLTAQNRLNLVLEDLSALRAQIESGAGESITWADQLTALTLQLKIYETAPSVDTTPIQLLLDSQANLTTSQRTEQLLLLDQLAHATENSLQGIEVELVELEPRIFELQREKQELSHQFDQLIRDRDVVQETYVTLARKIDEVRIQSGNSGSGLKVASLAVPPANPERLNIIVIAPIAGLVGLLLSTAAIIAITWWKAMNSSAPS